MAYDLSKVTLGSNGMVQLGPGQFVNANNLSPAGYAMAINYNLNKDGTKANVTFDKSTGSTSSSMLPPGSSTSYTTPSYTNYVSDSSSVVKQENQTIDYLKGLMGSTPSVNNTVTGYGQSIDALTNYYNLLEQRRQQEIERISKEFDIVQQETETAQKRETGATNVALTRLGGYLGGVGSAGGVMQNLAVTQRAELSKLAAQRQSAIAKAQSAIDDKQFAVARAMVEEARQAEQQIYQRQQDFFNNALKLQGEFRSQQDQYAQNVKDLLDKWQYLPDTSSIKASDRAYVDNYYGSGFTENYLKTLQTAKQAQARKDEVAAVQAYINLIKSVPAGTKIPIGGKTVTAIGDVSDISTFHVEDTEGNVRIVNYNKGTGQYSVTNVGPIGTPSGGAGGTISNYMNAFTPSKMLPDGTPVLDINGKANPKAWNALIEDASANKINRADFIKQFGYLLYRDEKGNVSAGYNLTPQEKALITGETY